MSIQSYFPTYRLCDFSQVLVHLLGRCKVRVVHVEIVGRRTVDVVGWWRQHHRFGTTTTTTTAVLVVGAAAVIHPGGAGGVEKKVNGSYNNPHEELSRRLVSSSTSTTVLQPRALLVCCALGSRCAACSRERLAGVWSGPRAGAATEEDRDDDGCDAQRTAWARLLVAAFRYFLSKRNLGTWSDLSVLSARRAGHCAPDLLLYSTYSYTTVININC